MFTLGLDCPYFAISLSTENKDTLELLKRSLLPFFFSFQIVKRKRLYVIHVKEQRQEHWTQFSIFINERFYIHINSTPYLIFLIQLLLLNRCIQSFPGFYKIHGAAVAHQSSAIVINAPKRTGKSTLSIALSSLGYQYLTDELVLLDPKTNAIWPFPRVIIATPATRKLLKSVFNQECTGNVAEDVFMLSKKHSGQKIKLKSMIFFSRARSKLYEFYALNEKKGHRFIESNLFDYAPNTMIQNVSFYRLRTDNFKSALKTIEQQLLS